MTMFDADAYLEAKETPRLKIGKKVYLGRQLSIEEYIPHLQKAEPFFDANAEEMSIEEAKKFAEDYSTLRYDFLRAIFPWKLSYILGDPVKKAKNSQAFNEVFTNFFVLTAANLNLTAEKNPEMSGIGLQNEVSQDTKK